MARRLRATFRQGSHCVGCERQQTAFFVWCSFCRCASFSAYNQKWRSSGVDALACARALSLLRLRAESRQRSRERPARSRQRAALSLFAMPRVARRASRAAHARKRTPPPRQPSRTCEGQGDSQARARAFGHQRRRQRRRRAVGRRARIFVSRRHFRGCDDAPALSVFGGGIRARRPKDERRARAHTFL